MTVMHCPLQILHLIGSTGLYGAERWILALLRAMDAARFQATLINLVDDAAVTSALVQSARQRGLTAFDFPTGGRFNPLAAVRLARLMRVEKVDIIHGHGFKSDLLGLLAARISGCRMMTTPHGWSLEADRKLQLYEKLDRWSFRYMDLVCPLSAELAEGISGLVKPSRLRLINNGVDIDEVRAAVSVSAGKSAGFTIGFIGQLIQRKDLMTLLAAVSRLRAAGVDVCLQIIGEGPKREPLQEEASRLGLTGKVEFHGFREDAAAYLKTFDLFVLPSLSEGIPRCLMESMAAGVPLVASDIPGNRNLVIPGESGLLFAPGDSRELAEKIAFMVSHTDEAQRMVQNALAKVEAEFSSRRMAREYSALYTELAGALP